MRTFDEVHGIQREGTCKACGREVDKDSITPLGRSGRCLDSCERYYQEAQEARWERIWQAAVAIRGTVSEGNETWVLNEAEALVQEWERRKEAGG